MRLRRLLGVAVLSCALLCGGCGGCEPEASKPAAERPIPRGVEGSRLALSAQTNYPMNRAVALEYGPDANPLLIATQQTAGRLVTIKGDGSYADHGVGDQNLGGIYRAEGGVVVLESTGRRVVKIGVGEDGSLSEGVGIDVEQSPRAFAAVPGTSMGWVLTRGDAAAPLALVDLASAEVLHRAGAGKTPVELIFDPAGAYLYVANFHGSSVSVLARGGKEVLVHIPVAKGPYRLAVAPEGATHEPHRIYVLHANSKHLTALDTQRRLKEVSRELSFIPTTITVSADGRYIYALSAGGGRLVVLESTTLLERQQVEVPVGSSDVVRFRERTAERILVSTGERGELWIFRPAGENLRRMDALSIEAAAGEIAATNNTIWLVGPRTGRVARFDIE